LLYETASVPADKIEDLMRASKRRGSDSPDFSLLTDGLLAEREQGITIDVAHVYFRTPARKFIVADTPGHEQYTRNMVTGASNSTVALVLVDVQNGSLLQTYRHFFISHTLRLPNIVVCINKMDLVDYRKEPFLTIVNELTSFATRIGFPVSQLAFVPVSAIRGDNVTTRSLNTPWYEGQPLLALLETIDTMSPAADTPLRFRIQTVIRSRNHERDDYRGYAGKIVSGIIRVGDPVVALPSHLRSSVLGIDIYDKKVESARAGATVTIRLRDDVDLSRGDIIVHEWNLPTTSKSFQARMCWLHEQSLKLRRRYLLQHGTRRVMGRIEKIGAVIHPESLEAVANADGLSLNDIGDVTVTTSEELCFDTYDQIKGNGSFIVIDESTNDTVAVGVFT
jgi:sulfate adenylyltransferase subunit 1